jgi:hypothetical protein
MESPLGQARPTLRIARLSGQRAVCGFRRKALPFGDAQVPLRSGLFFERPVSLSVPSLKRRTRFLQPPLTDARSNGGNCRHEPRNGSRRDVLSRHGSRGVLD